MKDVAIALRFIKNLDSAPKVIATGEGNIAHRIVELALKNDVQIVHDEILASALKSIPKGIEIPEKLYQVVAILFRHLQEKNPLRAAVNQNE